MINKAYNILFNKNLTIANNLKLDLKSRPGNISKEKYYEITKEYRLNIAQDNIYNLYNVIEDQRAGGLTFEEIIKENSLELNNYISVNKEGINFSNNKIQGKNSR